MVLNLNPNDPSGWGRNVSFLDGYPPFLFPLTIIIFIIIIALVESEIQKDKSKGIYVPYYRPQNMKRKKIETEKDIELLVRTFYGRVLQNKTLAPKFAGLDMEQHFPVMIRFWSTLLLNTSSYSGNAFEKHVSLNLGKKEFHAWLVIFCKTVDDLFAGEKAELAKERARSIASIFQSKLGIGD